MYQLFSQPVLFVTIVHKTNKVSRILFDNIYVTPMFDVFLYLPHNIINLPHRYFNFFVVCYKKRRISVNATNEITNTLSIFAHYFTRFFSFLVYFLFSFFPRTITFAITIIFYILYFKDHINFCSFARSPSNANNNLLISW